MHFKICSGSTIGYEHVRLGTNNQDGKRAGEVRIGNKEYLFGVVCDGCSGGHHNEIGAKLLANYICSEIPMMLKVGSLISHIPQALFMRCIGYLRSIASQTVAGDPIKMVEFIKDHLLCTIAGFIMDDENCFTFSAGDGVIVINEIEIRIDQHNRPMYLAYHLVDPGYLNLQGG